MAHPYLALRPTRNGRVSHYAVAGSKNPLPLDMGSVKNAMGMEKPQQISEQVRQIKSRRTPAFP